MELLYKDESFAIVGAAMAVHRALGSGYLEKVYQEAFAVELKLRGIPFEREKQYTINYKGVELEQKYIADFVCYDKIIVELKAVSQLVVAHTSQVLNYLNCSGCSLGLLINFGESSLKHKRIVLSDKDK